MSDRWSPIPPRRRSRSFPACPTNGIPCWSSWKPGASPTNMRSASGFPTPKTTWVRPSATLEQLELVLVLPAAAAAGGLDDDVEREVHRLDPARGAREGQLEVHVPAPVSAAVQERDPDRVPVAFAEQPEVGDVPEAVVELPFTAGEETGEALAATRGLGAPVALRAHRHLPARALGAPEHEHVRPVVDDDHRPGCPEAAPPDVLDDDHLSRRPRPHRGGRYRAARRCAVRARPLVSIC